MKQKKSKKASGLLKALSIGVCGLFLLVFALISFPIRKTQAEKFPASGGEQVHEAGFENKPGVFYESGFIKITDGHNIIYIKDRNQGALVSSLEQRESEIFFKNLQRLRDAREGYISCPDNDNECKNKFLEETQSVLGDDITEYNILNEIDNYLSKYEDYKEYSYKDTFGNYYYWGNNHGATYDELNVDENNGITISETTYLNGFNGGTIDNPGWKEISLCKSCNNPCNLEGEYLPTIDDWNRVINIYNNSVGDDFFEDLLIPNAGYIYKEDKEPFVPHNRKGGDTENGNLEEVIVVSDRYKENYGLRTAKKDGEIGNLGNGGVVPVSSLNNFESIAQPVRCFVYKNPVTVTFDTDGYNEIPGLIVEKGSSISEPEIEPREGYRLLGWYIDPEYTEEFDFENDNVTQNITLYAKWKEYGVLYKNGYIKITDGENSIYIKDRNQGAENSLREKPSKLQLLSDLNEECSLALECVECCNCAGPECCAASYEFKATCPEGYLEQASQIIGDEVESYEEVQDYMENYDRYEDFDYISSFGTYYYRGNNSGVHYSDLELDGDEIVNSEYLSEIGFEEGIFRRSSNNRTEGSSNTPCDANKGEYLPTLEDWDGAIELWGNVIRCENDSSEEFLDDSQGIQAKKTESTAEYENYRGIVEERATENREERIIENNIQKDSINDEESIRTIFNKSSSVFLSDMLIPVAGYIRNEKFSAVFHDDSETNSQFVGQKEEETERLEKKGMDGDYEKQDNDETILNDEIKDDSNDIKEDCKNCNENQESVISLKTFIYDDIHLWTALGDNNSVGILRTDGLIGDDDIGYDEINKLAMPVRCFLEVNTVTLNINGGDRMEEVEIMGNQTLKGLNIEDPTIEGYTFLGWYMDSEYTKPFSDTEPITSDTVLYARWQNNATNTIEQPITTTNTNNGGRLKKDKCPGGDFSDSYYDGTCEKSTKTTHNASSTVESPYQKGEELKYDTLKYNPKYSDEMNQAYQYAYYYGITTKGSIKEADVNGELTRVAMAKMLSQYAINVLGMKPDTSRVNKFADVSDKLDSNYDNGVTLAYQLGIMGINMKDNKFRPNDEVSRAEFVTALSRMKYGTKDGKDKYYSTHMDLLEKLGIITNTDPTMKEARGYVMLMLMRSGNN